MRVPFQGEFAATKPRPKKKSRSSGDDQKRNSLLPIHVRKIVQPRRFAINNSAKTGRRAHLDITTNPLSSAEWRRGSGRGGAPQELLASTDQKPLSPALSPRFAAGRGSHLRW